MINLIAFLVMLFCWKKHELSGKPEAGDLVINELLFDPPDGGYDYVEIFNRSTAYIDLRGLLIATRNSTGDFSNAKVVSRDSVILRPEGFLVITANEKWLRQRYPVPEEAVVCQVSQMPSFPNDHGIVCLLTADHSLLDELDYSSKWHFAMIAEASGVALERIDYNGPTQNAANWTSASSSAHYGTPGYTNSCYFDPQRNKQEASIPTLFSPDGDGDNDVALISYQMKESGYMLNTTIYNFSGRMVRRLVKNELLGSSALYQWDGLDDNARPLPQGMYVVITEMFNLKGITKKYRNALILTRK